jgi:hypothetical protein
MKYSSNRFMRFSYKSSSIRKLLIAHDFNRGRRKCANRSLDSAVSFILPAHDFIPALRGYASIVTLFGISGQQKTFRIFFGSPYDNLKRSPKITALTSFIIQNDHQPPLANAREPLSNLDQQLIKQS